MAERKTKKTTARKVPAKKAVVKSRRPKPKLKRSASRPKASGKGIRKVLKKKGVKLTRAFQNPIIEPRPYTFESKATLNPAAFEANGKVHLIYRAIGDDDSSVLGYAGSYDGYNISERPPYPVYRRSNNFNEERSLFPIDYISGGGWNGGCEDPRLTRMGESVYMLYTAFDGWGSVRIALTSIALSDFEKKKWNWRPPVLISPPGEIHKNWVIFPEKINDKYAILTSISPKIAVEYVDRMEVFDGKKFLRSHHNHTPLWPTSWDTSIRGVGPTPIKTDIGWLVLYHAMDRTDPNRYKLGAMVLDLKNPEKILYHASTPILEPDVHYENNGYKWGVIYSCGAVVKNGTLFVYYGGADKVIGVATISLDELLEDLKKNKVVKLKKQAVNL